MKSFLSAALAAFLVSLAPAQNVLFSENFEPPGYGDSVTSSTYPNGSAHWAVTGNLASSGLFADSCKTIGGDTSYLTTTFFDASSSEFVYLRFWQVCKINIQDFATIQISSDSGLTWTNLSGNDYYGSSNFGSSGNGFNAASYSTDWLPNDNLAQPQPGWFREELFDITGLCDSSAHCALRFCLIDGGSSLNAEYGWLIDDITIVSSPFEMIPPAVSLFNPHLQGVQTSPGPFLFYVATSDLSGIYAAYVVFVIDGQPDTLWLPQYSGQYYLAQSGLFNHLDNVCYHAEVMDNSPLHNLTRVPDTGEWCFTVNTEKVTLIDIVQPANGCALSLEPVELKIKNNGVSVISGDFQAKYWIEGRTDTVTEDVTITIQPGQYGWFTFDSLLDLGTYYQDTVFRIGARLMLLGDLDTTDDQMFKNITALYLPSVPPVVYDTVDYWSSATLVTVPCPGCTVKWYADSLGQNLLHIGDTFQTSVLISDFVIYRTFTEANQNCITAPFPYYVRIASIPEYDIAITAQVAPVSGVYLTANERITIQLLNGGQFAANNFPLSYILDSGAVVTEYYPGTLASGASTYYSFTASGNLSSYTSYDLKVWCSLSGDTVGANDTLFSLVQHLPANYCLSSATYGSSGSDIGNVTFSNLNNGIPTPTNNNVTAINAYTDFTSSVPPVQLATGQLYPLTVKKINKGNTNSFSVIKVFIDYNRSGTYEEATETVLNVATNPGTYQVSSNITIPQWVNPGQAQMRVVLQETTNQSYVHPCGSYSYGETEDYMVYLYNVFPVDAGIEQIISPASTVPQASSQSVSVSIRNYGLDTLTSLTITYQHNNNAPVVQSWTGTLLPSASTIVLLSNPLTVAPFSNTLCVSTSVPGDVNFINDQICKTFNGELLQDAIAVAIIDSFNTACDVGMEEITLRIKNVGLDTISGGLTGSYYIVGQTNVVTETINATIPPDSSYNYTFNQDVDLTAYTQDTIWKLVAYFTLVGDIENELDTAYASVESLYSPPEPLVSNVSIPYATAATLSASSSDSIFWYESQNAQQEIGSGPTYTTPILYGRKVYWVEAQADVGADAVSIGTGTSSQNYIPFFYNYDYGWSAMIYTAAELGIDGKIDTIGFYVTTSHNNYTHVDQKLYLGHTTTSTFPDGAYPGTTGLTLVWDDDLVINGPGWLRIPFQQSFDYNGTDNLLILWENREGTYLGNPTIQFAASNTSVNRAKYKYQDGSFPTSSGTLTANRPNIILYGRGVGCPGPRVPDTVFISSNIPLVDGSLIGVASPISSSSFGHSETVTVSIQNYGTQAIGNFPISLQVNNGNVVTETIGNSIGPDSVMDYSFTFGVNMLNYGNYDFKVWLDIPYDSFPANDTLAFHIIHPIPEYCPSFATNPSVYEDIGNVSLGTLNNGDTTPVIQNPNAIQGYTDFTQSVVPPILFQNKAYALSVAATSSATINPLPTYVRGYFDLNRDGILDPVSERLFSETIRDTSRVATASVSIPDTSAYGTMLMRVVLDRLTSAPPCGSYSYGETEDYLVEVWPSAIVPPYSCITRDQTGNVLVSWDTVPSQAATFLHYKLLYRELPSGSFILLDSISTASVLSFTHIGSPAGTALEYKLECWFNRDDYVFSVPAFDTIVPYIAGDVLKCVGDTVTVWLGGGYDALDTIVWGFGTANVLSGIGFGPYKLSYPSAGSFQILATLQQACGTSYLRTDVAVYPQPQLQVTGPHYFCPDVPLILVASGGTNYLWNNGSTSDTLILSGLTMPTLLSVTVSEPGGCFEAKNIFIHPIETFQNSEICIVSTEQTQDNTIQWFPVPGKDTKAYNVYFADAALPNQWNLLGQWSFDASGQITDSLHHSPAYQLQYAIQVVDSCDSLSVLSPEVGPLYLSGELVGGVVNLEWENYIGPVPTSEVIIYRKEGSGSYSIIDTVSMFDQTYSDVAPPQGMVYYYLEIEGFNCPFSGSPSKASNSNVVVVNTVGLPENGIPGLEVFLVQKGPALLIRWNENIPKTMNLTIFDALGRISRRSSLPHLSSQYIDLASLVPGVYSYQLTLGDGRMISGKLIR